MPMIMLFSLSPPYPPTPYAYNKPHLKRVRHGQKSPSNAGPRWSRSRNTILFPMYYTYLKDPALGAIKAAQRGKTESLSLFGINRCKQCTIMATSNVLFFRNLQDKGVFQCYQTIEYVATW